jgi:hypothetical protein
LPREAENRYSFSAFYEHKHAQYTECEEGAAEEQQATAFESEPAGVVADFD